MSNAESALAKVEHVVVLMMENRSFDHMLGYLSLEGGRDDIDGLRAGMANDYGGRSYPIHHLERTAFEPAEDPDHSGEATSVQIAGGDMSGFVDSFAAKLAQRGVSGHDPGLVMGYYNASDLPGLRPPGGRVLRLRPLVQLRSRRHLAEPAVRDRRPRRRHPRRQALGTVAVLRPPVLRPPPRRARRVMALVLVRPGHSALRRQALLALALGPLRLRRQDEAVAGRPSCEELPLIDEASRSFLEDAALGTLPAVSWVDPNFKDSTLYGGDSNDDHPPSDVRDGQLLVLSVYHALASGPLWDKTLLVITYDEHGGFHDHVPPPAAEDDDPAHFGQYGIRVPALVVSPWVARGSVSNTLFDHTSIIKTILLRFCGEADLADHGSHLPRVLAWLDSGHPHYMGKRTALANQLGELLTEPTPRPAPGRDALVEDAATRKAEQVKAALMSTPTGGASPLTELQIGVALAARELRRKGLPPAQP